LSNFEFTWRKALIFGGNSHDVFMPEM